MIDPIALEDAVYWLLCERSAQMGEAYTHEMHVAAKAEDQDYISDIRFQVKSAIKAYEAAKAHKPLLVSLEKCAIAVAPAWFEEDVNGKYPEEAEQRRRKARITAKAVLNAAGVLYVE